MTAFRGWTPSDVDRLMQARAAGLSFDVIGGELNRTPDACQQAFYLEQRRRKAERAGRFAQLAARSRQYEAARPKPVPVAIAVPARPPGRPAARGGRSVLSALLRDGVDVRDIDARGITAVVLGDPLPGRSALDERRRS
jgi:hypothetical protein